MSRQIQYVAAEIEIPERVEVFRSDDTQTDFAYPVKVQAKHAAISPSRLIGGRWFFGLNGRGYYVKDETLPVFGIEPHVTPCIGVQTREDPSGAPLDGGWLIAKDLT